MQQKSFTNSEVTL